MSDAVNAGIRVGRGVTETGGDGRLAVGLSNLHNTPITIRAGQVVGYARTVEEDEFAEMEYNLHALEDDIEMGSGKVCSMGGGDEGVLKSNPFFSPVGQAEEKDGAVKSLPIIPATDEEVIAELAGMQEKVRALFVSLTIIRSLADVPEHLRVVQLGEGLNPAQQRLAWTLLRAHADVFNESSTVPTRTTKYRADIDTGNARPVSSAPYRVSPAERKIIDKSVDEMLDAGVIRPSRSPWSSGVVLVSKKDNSVRFCVDYKKLNKLTKIETYPLPRIDETLRAFQGAKCFSVLDMQSGYWQIPLHEDAIPKTAFISHRGLFEFVVMPFGPANAPGYFQRMMDEVMGGLKWTSVLVYIDDIIVFSPDFGSHMADLMNVFKRLAAAGLTLKPKKCQVFAKSVKYLGSVVSAEGIAPDPDKVKAIAAMPAPVDKAGVKAFLGMAGYYRRFIGDFAEVMAPLQMLLKNDVPFIWADAQENAMRAVKAALCSAPVLLAHPDFSKPFVLTTDASGVGIGAVLSQNELLSMKEAVVEYASRTLTKAEGAWSATEQEALAVKWGCEVMRPYIYGVRFTVITDHRALQWVFLNRSKNHRLQRWAVLLSEYDFKVVHRAGRLNANADGPSRLPLPRGQGIGEGADGLPDERATIAAARTFTEDVAHDIPEGKVIVEKRRVASDILADHVLEHGGVLPGADEITDAILTDETFGAIYAYMMDGIAPPGAGEKYEREIQPFYCMDGALLLAITGQKKWFKHGPSAITTRVVVPKTLRVRIISHHHVQPECGHMSAKATYARFCQLFWWPGMWRDTAKYVETCTGCQLGDRRAEVRVGPLVPIDVECPWDLVGIDLVGPFKTTPRGYKHVLTMIDYYTRWVIFVPLHESKAKDVVEAVMEHLVNKYGMPVGMISDRGSQFTGGLYQRLMARLGVQHNTTTAYHPQANGRIERVHRTLNAMLAKQVNIYHNNWDEYVSAAAFAVNTAWSRSTGSTPYELLFGRRPRIPSEIVYGSRIDIKEDKKTYGLQLPMILRDAHRRVRKVHESYVQRMADYYNAGRKSVRFQPGDVIKLYQPALQPHLPQRMQLRYTGPHKVVRVIKPQKDGDVPLNYEINVNGKMVICNVARMRKYVPSMDAGLVSQPDDLNDGVVEAAESLNDAEVDAYDIPDEPMPLRAEMSEEVWKDILRDVTAVAGRKGRDGHSFGEEEVKGGEGEWGAGDASVGLDDGSGGMDVGSMNNDKSMEVSVAMPRRGWDNVLEVDIPPAVPRNAIIHKQHVLAWTDGEDGIKRWWPGVVWDRPSAKRPSITMQPFNSWDRKRCIHDATFALVWWDPRALPAGKEVWKMVPKPYYEPYLMDVPMGQVFLLDVQWRDGRKLPLEALTMLGYASGAEEQVPAGPVVTVEAEPSSSRRPGASLRGSTRTKRARR